MVNIKLIPLKQDLNTTTKNMLFHIAVVLSKQNTLKAKYNPRNACFTLWVVSSGEWKF